jgi:EAL domain-containing protein (putative c-di-GMP-specific phosphodiesterase class I)
MSKLTIAEHVETPEVLAAVREIGIDLAQGYAIGRPIPLAQSIG